MFHNSRKKYCGHDYEKIKTVWPLSTFTKYHQWSHVELWVIGNLYALGERPCQSQTFLGRNYKTGHFNPNLQPLYIYKFFYIHTYKPRCIHNLNNHEKGIKAKFICTTNKLASHIMKCIGNHVLLKVLQKSNNNLVWKNFTFEINSGYHVGLHLHK